MSDYRAEALAKLVDNGVSAANMEIWIAGYIAGREESEIYSGVSVTKRRNPEHETREFIPEGVYTSDGYTLMKDLQEL